MCVCERERERERESCTCIPDPSPTPTPSTLILPANHHRNVPCPHCGASLPLTAERHNTHCESTHTHTRCFLLFAAFPAPTVAASSHPLQQSVISRTARTRWPSQSSRRPTRARARTRGNEVLKMVWAGGACKRVRVWAGARMSMGLREGG